MLGLGLGPCFCESGGAAPFTPASIAGLALWLRGDLGISIGTGVSAWADQSGSGDMNKNAVQATGALQPTVTASDVNYGGKQTLAFGGTQYLNSGTWTTPLAQPSTWYAVGHIANGASGFKIMTDGLDSTHRQSIASGNPNWSIFSGVGQPTATVTSLTPAVVCGVFNGAGSAIYVSNSQTASGTGNPGTQAMIGLGVANFSGISSMSGTIAEIIGYSGSHSATTRLQIMAYLGARYALAVS